MRKFKFGLLVLVVLGILAGVSGKVLSSEISGNLTTGLGGETGAVSMVL